MFYMIAIVVLKMIKNLYKIKLLLLRIFGYEKLKSRFSKYLSLKLEL